MNRSPMLRPFFLLLVALALLASPAIMSSGDGMASAHSAMSQAGEMQGHCPGDSGGPGDREMSCVSACAALPATESRVVEPTRPANGQFAPVAHQVFVGVQPEGETPPPRIAPEI